MADWKHARLEELVDFMKRAVACKLYKPDPLIPIQIQPSPEIFGQVYTRDMWTGSASCKE